MSVIDKFQHIRRSYPSCDAAIAESGQVLSFEQLGLLTEKISGWLVNNTTISQGDVVLVCVNRSEKSPAIIMGTMIAGGVYLECVPDSLPARLSFVIEDSQAKIAIVDNTSQEKMKTLLADDAFICNIDTISNPFKPFIPSPVSNGSPAYLIYTSGTTGQPKGVLISHGALENLLTALDTVLYDKFQGRIREGLTSAPTFDASIQQYFSCLWHGNTLVIPSEETRKSPYKLTEFVNRHKINMINIVASYVRLLYNIGCLPNAGPSLQRIVTGGEAVTKSLIKHFYKDPSIQHISITNMYGPTENCIDSSYYHIDSSFPNDRSTVPIGFPIPGTEISIRDDSLQIAPVGEVNEIFVSGAGLAIQYINLKQANKEKFVICPNYGIRLYRTGDMGFYNTFGELEFVGRADDQIKINGYRIELQEIESVIESFDPVQGAVVTPLQAGSENALVAFVVSATAIDKQALRFHVEEQLPSYMCPGQIIQVKKFPAGNTGKVDKIQLLENFYNLNRTSPLSKKEHLSYWQALLSIDNVKSKDDFFLLGGNSLKAIQLINLLKQNHDCNINASDLYKNACFLNFHTLAINSCDNVKTKQLQKSQRNLDQHLPLSALQRNMHYLYKYTNKGPAYNILVVFRFPSINQEKLEAVLKVLLDRHIMLRVAFHTEGTQVTQQIIPASEVNFFLERKNDYIEVYHKEEKYVFDLSSACKLRATIVAGENQALDYLILNLPHICIDGWSLTIFFEEFNTLYHSDEFDGTANLLEPTHYNYADYIDWQEEVDFQSADRYWLTHLSKVSNDILLPFDSITKSDQLAGQTVMRSSGNKCFMNVRACARYYSTTEAVILLTCFFVLISQLSEKTDICIGMGILGRSLKEFEKVVGLFANILPIRANLKSEDDLENIISDIANTVSQALDHQDLPLDQILIKYANDRLYPEKPLFDFLFAYQNFNGVRSKEKASDTLMHVNNMLMMPRSFTKFNLSLYTYECEDEFIFEFEYDSNYYSQQRISGWIDRYIELVELITDSHHCVTNEGYNET